MKTSEFFFELPETHIARFPLDKRSDSRLLIGNPNTATLTDSFFTQLPNLLNPGDLLVFNDSRVLPARLYAKKVTGGRVEILIERLLDNNQALVHLGSNKRISAGQILFLNDNSKVIVKDKKEHLFLCQFEEDLALLTRLEKIGHMPLPPYLKRDDTPEDTTRYQTVYARDPGSVAAPTAGLHFDEALLQQLSTKGIELSYLTLHVGAGTFQPVRVENIEDHHMHPEWVTLPELTCQKISEAKARGNKIIAVGTTSLRCLEALAQRGPLEAFHGEVNIFIHPGFKFQIVDRLITNFHLPESTLLMLVSAFIGMEFARQLYTHAIAEQYRFYSYGDSCLLDLLQ